VSRQVRVAHITTIDMSLALLLGTELRFDVEQGFDVFALSAPGPYVGAIEALGVTFVPLPSLTRSWDVTGDLAGARELWRALRRIRPDVLHTHTPKPGVVGRILGRLAGVPVVVNTCHGLWATPDDPPVKRWLVYGAEALAAQFSDHELFQNSDDRETLRWAIPDGKATVVGNGVDLQRFAYDGEGRARVRAELGVGHRDLLVGGVGRRVAEKGIVELAQVARALHDRATFVWVGPDDDKPDALGRDIAGLRIVPARIDMPAVYSALDVFVLPSHREGFSRSAMEAAACGRPMVLSDIRGCREIGENGTELLLVPPRDPAALEAAITRLLDDAALRDRLGAAAEQRARTAFDQRRVAATSIETYRKVAARKRLAW